MSCETTESAYYIAQKCADLSELYNATLLEDLPECLQDAFRKQCEKNKTHDDKPRVVLSELISNYYNKTAPNVNFIGGPFSLTCQCSKQYKKLIYMFGEEHSSTIDCDKLGQLTSVLSFEDYLKQFIPTTSSFLDIFLEIHSRKRGYFRYEKDMGEYDISAIRLYKIASEFNDCLNDFNADKDYCKLARFHYIDVRSIERKTGPDPISKFIIEYEFIISQIYTENIDEQDFEEQDLVDQLINFLVENASTINTFLIPKDKKEFDKIWTDMLTENEYVVKEFKNTDQEIGKLIKDFIEKEILLEARQHSEGIITYATLVLSNISKWPRTEYDDLELIKNLESLVRGVISPNSRIQDAYTLARIFKKFNLNPDTKKKRHTDEPEEAHNIIIYAGDNHCEIYRKFLSSVLNFTPIARIGGNPDMVSTDAQAINCLNMKEFDIKPAPAWGFFPAVPGWSIQPLFSSWPPPIQPGITNININSAKKSSKCSVMLCKKETDYINKRLRRNTSRYSSSSEELTSYASKVIRKYIPLFKETLKSLEEENKDGSYGKSHKHIHKKSKNPY